MSIARIIPSKSKIPPKLRVAAYCRISTRSDGQQSRLVAQEHYYEDHIKQNPSWILDFRGYIFRYRQRNADKRPE